MGGDVQANLGWPTAEPGTLPQAVGTFWKDAIPDSAEPVVPAQAAASFARAVAEVCANPSPSDVVRYFINTGRNPFSVRSHGHDSYPGPGLFEAAQLSELNILGLFPRGSFTTIIGDEAYAQLGEDGDIRQIWPPGAEEGREFTGDRAELGSVGEASDAHQALGILTVKQLLGPWRRDFVSLGTYNDALRAVPIYEARAAALAKAIAAVSMSIDYSATPTYESEHDFCLLDSLGGKLIGPRLIDPRLEEAAERAGVPILSRDIHMLNYPAYPLIPATCGFAIRHTPDEDDPDRLVVLKYDETVPKTKTWTRAWPKLIEDSDVV